MIELSQARLKEMLSYDPETGLFVWVKKPNRNIRVGAKAGCRNQDGYILIGVDGTSYMSHRLAVLFMTGDWPKEQVDHINGHRADNRWENLRDASHSQNQRNMKMPVHNTSGFKGVSTASKGKTWFAQIWGNDGKHIHLGTFTTKQEAAAAYDAAAVSLHGDFARTNKATPKQVIRDANGDIVGMAPMQQGAQ